jgi:hypothetical protein
MAARAKAAKGPAVYCHGGPLDGMAFTLEDWERRRVAEQNMAAAGSEQAQRSLLYRAPRREGLPSTLRPSQVAKLDGYQVRTWVPERPGTPCPDRLPHASHVPAGWGGLSWCPGLLPVAVHRRA